MKIAYITAGAGGMYCGSCLRDNTLAAALVSAGHHVSLIPTYTPTRTDEPNVSEPRVFLGGINVYLEQKLSLFRKAPRLLKRILDLNPLLRLATNWNIRIDPAHLGRLTVSMLEGGDKFMGDGIGDLVRHLQNDVKPDVVNLPNSLLLGLAPAIRAGLRVPICCTLQGEDLFLRGLHEPYRSDALALIRGHVPRIDRFLAVSRFCAAEMGLLLRIPPDKIRVARLGINVAGYERRPPTDSEPLTVGYLARIAPEKGLHLLCKSYRALRSLSSRPMRLWAAGYLPREHGPYLENIRRDLSAWGLAHEFRYWGELDRHQKIDFLRKVDVFSVPCTYDEPKGIFLLEAMAAGVPVVQPRRGVFPEIVERTAGGILAEPDSADDLARALLRLCEDPGLRNKIGMAAFDGVRDHFTASAMAGDALAIYQEVIQHRTPEELGSAQCSG